MTAPLLQLPFLGAALLLTLSARAAEPPADHPADPLPPGATARLGTARLRDANSWGGAGMTADGKYLAGNGPAGLLRYNVATGATAGATGPKGGQYGGRTEFTADGTRAVTSGFGGASVWDVDGGKVLAKIDRPLPYGDTGAVSASADGSVVALGGGKSNDPKDKGKPVTALVWDVAKNEKRAEIAVAQNQSANVALSPDGKTLATWGNHYEPNPPKVKDGDDPPADPSRLVQFWDAATGKEMVAFRADGFGVSAIAFAPDGATAAVGTGGGLVRLVDPKTGTETRRLFGRGDLGNRFAFSPDGKTIAAAGNDGTVQLWAADGGRPSAVECPVGPLSNGVRGLCFTANDRAVAWTAIGSTAVAWEVPSGRLLSPFAGHLSGVTALAYAAGGKELLSGGADGQLLRWDAATGKELGGVRLRSPAGYGTGTRFTLSPVFLTADGTTAYSIGTGAGVFDAATGRQLATPTLGLNYDLRPYLCADARTLLTVPAVPYPPKPVPKTLKVAVWDTQSGARLAGIEVPPGDLVAAAVTPDRKTLVTALATRPADPNGKAEFQVTAWELATGKKLGEYAEAAGYGPGHVVPAPDNATAVVATPNGKLLSVELAAGKVAKEFDAGGERATGPPAFGPGGKQFAVPLGTGFNRGGARVFDAATGKPGPTFVGGHRGPVTAIAFSPDGTTLATGSQDTTVLLWNLAAAGKGDE